MASVKRLEKHVNVKTFVGSLDCTTVICHALLDFNTSPDNVLE